MISAHRQMAGIGGEIHVDAVADLVLGVLDEPLDPRSRGLAAHVVEQAQPRRARATVPTTSGTILALKSQRSAKATAVPITTIMNIVNSWAGSKRGVW